MERFIQLHLLTSYPPSNLNRDDLGRPKTAKMGGVDRLRVSSQSLKRAWRTSSLFEQALAGYIGTRTKGMGLKIYAQLKEKGVEHKLALEWSKPIAGVFGKLKTLSKKDKDGLKKLSKEEREKKESGELEIEQLAFIDIEEERAISALSETIAEREKGADSDELNLLRKKVSAVDIALFGRMLASSPAYNVEAACQVAHSISVHPVAIEDDYFTALDDLNNGSDDAGAAHIGETGFAAGLFYSYICINRELLINNLGGDEELANRAISALVEAAVKVAPEGKQNSFASRAYASYLLAEKGNQQPRSLSVAFLKPVTACDDDDYGKYAVAALERQNENMDRVYGKCADERCSINAASGEGSFDKLLKFVTE